MNAPSLSSPVLDNRFLLLERLGTGGMGSVYRAFDRLDERSVALKVLRREVPFNPPEALADEFRSWASLRHPFIVRAHEFRVSRDGPVPPGTPYLVLEYVRGGPVHRALRPGEVSPATLEEFARRMLAALEHVHSAGIVHRDLKPGNILVGTSRNGLGRVKLTDFGLAAPSGVRREFGRFSGSLSYMAPESVLGAPLDGRTDLYALGVVLHLLAAGRLPFDAGDSEAAIRWHLERGGADPRQFRREVPDRFARFVARLTRTSPADRPRDARHALETLGAPKIRARSSPVSCRGARAMIRLALDAARSGSPRVVPHPASPGITREIAVAAQLDGFVVQRLRPASGNGSSNLDRLVLRALLEDDDAAREWDRRTEETRVLPLHLLGKLPLRDRLGHGRPEPAGDDGARSTLARAVAAVWMRLARGPGLLLIVEAGATRDPLARDALAALRERLQGGPVRALLLVSPNAVGGGALSRRCRRDRRAGVSATTRKAR